MKSSTFTMLGWLMRDKLRASVRNFCAYLCTSPESELSETDPVASRLLTSCMKNSLMATRASVSISPKGPATFTKPVARYVTPNEPLPSTPSMR